MNPCTGKRNKRAALRKGQKDKCASQLGKKNYSRSVNESEKRCGSARERKIKGPKKKSQKKGPGAITTSAERVLRRGGGEKISGKRMRIGGSVTRN